MGLDFFDHRNKHLVLIFFVLISKICISQVEFCGNGLDDDGDGLVDIWDVEDCPCIPGSSINDCPSECTYTLANVPYESQLLWSAERIDGRETTFVGDVDNDGVPEIIYDDYRNPGKIYIVDGITGTTEHVINTGLDLTQNSSGNGIADTDSDGFGEIYLVDDARRFHRYDFDGTNWSLTWTTNYLIDNDQLMPGFADFNADGNPEVYLGDQVIDPQTGNLITNSTKTITSDGQSVVGDILPTGFCPNCAGLEIAVGGRVYAVDIATGTITQEVTLNTANDGDGFGPTSIADVDNDGDLDIVYTSRQPPENRANLIVWDGQTDNLLMPLYLTPPGLSNLQSSINGRVNIADFDGDGFVEFGYVGREIYQIVDDVFQAGSPTVIWSLLNTDKSAITGSTVFDFEADGQAEVVYRDEDSLYILEGPTGNVLFSTYCTSGTRYEYPVVADINADGATEIVVSCSNSGVNAYRSANAPWAPSRKVWNQHAYNVTNVNDDLTIPSIPAFNPTFLGGKFNNFLVQSTPIDASGNPVLKASDLQILSSYVKPIYCGDCITVEFLVTNNGEVAVPNLLPISLYDGDPTTTNANLITTVLSQNQIQPGEVDKIVICVPYTGDIAEAFFVTNDPGTLTTPYNFDTDFPVTSIAECNYNNNIKKVVIICNDKDNDGVIDDIDCNPNDANVTFTPANKCKQNFNNSFQFGN